MKNLLERITLNPKDCHGKPAIRKMRYSVENKPELRASGMMIENLLADYPDLEKEDFLECLQNEALLTQLKRINTLAS